MTTIYEHDGKELFRDEPDAYQIEDIRTHYAQFDKRLLTATYTVIPPEKEGEPRRVVFAKKTGTKGGHPVIEALIATPPTQVAAFELLAELQAQAQLTPEALLLKAPEIEMACMDLAELASRCEKVTEHCLKLKPAAASTLPVGF